MTKVPKKGSQPFIITRFSIMLCLWASRCLYKKTNEKEKYYIHSWIQCEANILPVVSLEALLLLEGTQYLCEWNTHTRQILN